MPADRDSGAQRPGRKTRARRQLDTASEPPPIRQLSTPELKALIESGGPFELVDVRTDEEARVREDRRLLASLISRITMRCAAWIRRRPSYSSATTAYAVSRPRSTSGVRDSEIFTICGVASTPGHSSSIPPCRATSVCAQVEAPDGRQSAAHRLRGADVPPPGSRTGHRHFRLLGMARQAPSCSSQMASECLCLPTQIVFSDDTPGHVRVGFGGMRFVGSEMGRLVFVRIRELVPKDSALAGSQSHDAARPAVGGHNFSRRPACLAGTVTLTSRCSHRPVGAHTVPLTAGRDLRYDQFLFVAVAQWTAGSASRHSATRPGSMTYGSDRVSCTVCQNSQPSTTRSTATTPTFRRDLPLTIRARARAL